MGGANEKLKKKYTKQKKSRVEISPRSSLIMIRKIPYRSFVTAKDCQYHIFTMHILGFEFEIND